MNNISMNQALDIWGELWQAYYGKNGFGGDTTEIYAYRLMPYNPTFHSPLSKEFCNTKTYEDAEKEVIKLAAFSLRNITSKFADDADCLVSVDGVDPDTWCIRNKEIFNHRCHVKVIRKDK